MGNDKVIRVFIDMVDWQHEIGEAAGGNRVYASAKDALHCAPCINSCGLVEVELHWVRDVIPQGFDKEKFEPHKTYLQYLEESLERTKALIQREKEKPSG